MTVGLLLGYLLIYQIEFLFLCNRPSLTRKRAYWWSPLLTRLWALSVQSLLTVTSCKNKALSNTEKFIHMGVLGFQMGTSHVSYANELLLQLLTFQIYVVVDNVFSFLQDVVGFSWLITIIGRSCVVFCLYVCFGPKQLENVPREALAK